MKSRIPFALVLALAALPSAAWAGPCTRGITKLQVAFDGRLDAAAANGPSGAETTDAKLHHQPTPQSIAQAEAKLGDSTPEMGRAFADAMQRARAADAANDKAGCRSALADARAALKN